MARPDKSREYSAPAAAGNLRSFRTRTLVFLQGTSDGPSELMPFERTLGVLEVVLGIQGAVTVIFEEVAMPLVRSGGGHNGDLPSCPFPILGTIGMLEDVVFPHGLDTQQLGTGSGGRDELVGPIAPNPVDTVDQKPVGFLPVARYRESGKTASASHIGSISDDAGVENQKLIEATTIQRQLLDLLLADESRRRTQCRGHQRSFLADRDLLRSGADFQGQ